MTQPFKFIQEIKEALGFISACSTLQHSWKIAEEIYNRLDETAKTMELREKWISVKDRLPELDKDVLVFDKWRTTDKKRIGKIIGLPVSLL